MAHKIFGLAHALNTANYVYFLAFDELTKIKDTSFISSRLQDEDYTRRAVYFHRITGNSFLIVPASLDHFRTAAAAAARMPEELLNPHRGQGLEILWRDSVQCPTEEEYISMVNGKTGGLFCIAVRLMMACATQNRDV